MGLVASKVNGFGRNIKTRADHVELSLLLIRRFWLTKTTKSLLVVHFLPKSSTLQTPSFKMSLTSQPSCVAFVLLPKQHRWHFQLRNSPSQHHSSHIWSFTHHSNTKWHQEIHAMPFVIFDKGFYTLSFKCNWYLKKLNKLLVLTFTLIGIYWIIIQVMFTIHHKSSWVHM